jgi:ABC-type dipeptide/oligopeptide/nickel transport system ATPase component
VTQPAFSVRNLTVFLQSRTGLRRVLDDVGLEVRKGRTFALLGESGSGKTCLVQSVLGLHPGEPGVVRGSAEVLGRDVFAESQRFVSFQDGTEPVIAKDLAGWRRTVRKTWGDRLGREVCLVPQDAGTSLSPFHTVGRMIEVALKRGNPDLSPGDSREEALRWLERVEMYDVEKVGRCYVQELSGGMAQRVAIALALAPGPELLIADEPTTGLDATLRISILALLKSMVAQRGATLLLVTHDNAAARLLASDVAVLYEGRVVETGPVGRVLDPRTAHKHPYTRFLLDSEYKLLEGGAPRRMRKRDAASVTGCPYAPQCDRVDAACESAPPPLLDAEGGHRIACLKREG